MWWRAIETMLGGRQVTRWQAQIEQFDVIVQPRPRGAIRPTTWKNLCAQA